MSDSDINKFKIKRSMQLTVLSSLNAFVKAFDSSCQTIDELEARTEHIASIIRKFEEYQQKLEKYTSDKENETIRIKFEDMLFETQTIVNKILKNKKKSATNVQVKLPKINLS